MLPNPTIPNKTYQVDYQITEGWSIIDRPIKYREWKIGFLTSKLFTHNIENGLKIDFFNIKIIYSQYREWIEDQFF